jgi:uncharacterized protein (TIGR03000 family)
VSIPRSLAARLALAAAGLPLLAAGEPPLRSYDIGGFGRGGAPDRGLVAGYAPGYGGYNRVIGQANTGPAYPGYFGPTFYTGVGFGYPFFPYYPGAYQSHWSNGYSLYGPPFRTDGAVPGAFGGSDQKTFGVPPSPYSGFGPNFGTNPRTLPQGNVQYPIPVITAGPNLRPAPSDPPADDGSPLPVPRKIEGEVAALRSQVPDEKPLPGGAVLDVTVADAAAEVLIDGRPTAMSGARRLFRSPPLEPGRTFTYEVEARWTANGQPVVARQTVEVSAGQFRAVDLTTPAASR